MLPDKLFIITSDILNIILKSSKPSDLVLSELLREKKFIGSKERKFVSASVFAIMRNITFLEYASKDFFHDFSENDNNLTLKNLLSLIILTFDSNLDLSYEPQHLLSRIYPNKENLVLSIIKNVICSLGLVNGTYSEFVKNMEVKKAELIERYFLNANKKNINDASIFYSCPEWILENISMQNLNPYEYAKSLNNSAPVCIRVTNPVYITQVTEMLENNNIPFHFSKIIQNCIILEERSKITETDEYKSGKFEVQDEGSQLIAYSLNPKGKSTILDACAGAGGKTIHIANLCPEAKLIMACDNNYLRLKDLPHRLKRYNFDNLSVKLVKSMDTKYLDSIFKNTLFDYILIDAPCTGMGTARRDPLKKFKITSALARKMHHKQVEILEAYSKYLKKGGILVYATCSTLSIENQETVQKFLERNTDFIPDNIYNTFGENNIFIEGLAPGCYYAGLMPHIHSTDGFFMARMKKQF